MTEPTAPFERHRLRPNQAGGVDYFKRPVFSRADWYTMLGAVHALERKEG